MNGASSTCVLRDVCQYSLTNLTLQYCNCCYTCHHTESGTQGTKLMTMLIFVRPSCRTPGTFSVTRLCLMVNIAWFRLYSKTLYPNDFIQLINISRSGWQWGSMKQRNKTLYPNDFIQLINISLRQKLSGRLPRRVGHKDTNRLLTMYNKELGVIGYQFPKTIKSIVSYFFQNNQV